MARRAYIYPEQKKKRGGIFSADAPHIAGKVETVQIPGVGGEVKDNIGFGGFGGAVREGKLSNKPTGSIPVEATTFPAGTTLKEVAESIYPQASGAGADLLKNSNSLRFVKGSDDETLEADQLIECPAYVVALNRGDASEILQPFVDKLTERLSQFKKKSLGNINAHPDYINAQLKILLDYADEDMAIISFYSPNPRISPADSGFYAPLSGAISVSCRDSLFEGARVFKVKMPMDETFSLGPEHGYGNHIAVAIKGVPVFMGLMITPKIDTKKSRTIEWTCMSHSYPLIKSHFNPAMFRTEWRDITPLEAVRYVSNVHGHPIWVGNDEQEALRIPYEDDDGLRNLGNDIRTSTPFKFLSNLVNAIGRFLHPSVTGFLEVQSIDIGQKPTVVLADGEYPNEAIPVVLSKFTVRYNFDELAGNYMVMEQKKKADGAQMVQISPFPIPNLFRNIVRHEAAPLVLDNVSRMVGLDEDDPYVPSSGLSEEAIAKEQASREATRERRKSTGATIFEISKAMANAIKIDVEVPGWYAPNGTPWQTGTATYVRSPAHVLTRVRGIITSVDFRGTNKKRVTNLVVTLSGAFDAVMPNRIPFIFDGTEELEYIHRDFNELLQDSKGNQSVEYD